MKALMYTEPGRVELRELPEPQVKPGTIKIRVDYVAFCGSDLHVVDHGMDNVPTPHLLGHESCGTIVALGEGMAELGWKLGDRVACAGASPCGECDDCKRGDDMFCKHRWRVRTFTEYALVRPNMIFRIPDGDDMLPYCLAEPCACALRGVDLMEIPAGATVALSGAGGIGSILLNLLLLHGGTKVTVFEPVASKRELALSLGAEYVVDPLTEDTVARGKEITQERGYDMVFEASGSPSAAPAMLDLVANKGKVMYFAVYPMQYELPVNLYRLYQKEASIHTAFTTTFHYHRVMNLIPKLQTEKIIGKVLPLSQGVEAFDLLRSSQYPKIVLECSDHKPV